MLSGLKEGGSPHSWARQNCLIGCVAFWCDAGQHLPSSPTHLPFLPFSLLPSLPSTHTQLVRLLLPPILVGTGIGLVALYHIHSLWLKRVLGLIFLSVGCYQIQGEVMRAKGLPAAAGAGGGQVVVEGAGKEGLRQMGRVLGLASGVLAGLFGTGGPPLMVLVAVTEVGKDEWRASNAVIWLVDNVFRFAYLYAVQGQVRAHGMRERSGEEEGIYVRVRVQYFFISVREGGKVIHLHAAS